MVLQQQSLVVMVKLLKTSSAVEAGSLCLHAETAERVPNVMRLYLWLYSRYYWTEMADVTIKLPL